MTYYRIIERIGGTIQRSDDAGTREDAIAMLDEREATLRAKAERFRAMRIKRTPTSLTLSEPRFGGSGHTVTTWKATRS